MQRTTDPCLRPLGFVGKRRFRRLDWCGFGESTQRRVFQMVPAKLAGLEDWQELGVPGENGVATKISGCFEGLLLQDGRTRSLQSVVVLQDQANGFLDGDSRSGGLRCDRLGWGDRRG